MAWHLCDAGMKSKTLGFSTPLAATVPLVSSIQAHPQSMKAIPEMRMSRMSALWNLAYAQQMPGT